MSFGWDIICMSLGLIYDHPQAKNTFFYTCYIRFFIDVDVIITTTITKRPVTSLTRIRLPASCAATPNISANERR